MKLLLRLFAGVLITSWFIIASPFVWGIAALLGVKKLLSAETPRATGVYRPRFSK